MAEFRLLTASSCCASTISLASLFMRQATKYLGFLVGQPTLLANRFETILGFGTFAHGQRALPDIEIAPENSPNKGLLTII